MAQRQMFDEQTREKIRRDLLRYSVAYKLGAPMLAKLISEFNDTATLIDHRRVGRFLAGHTERRKSSDPKHKPTNPDPIFLGWCAKFLESAKLPPDPLRELADQIKSFAVGPSGGGYTGNYTLTLLNEDGTRNSYISAEVKIEADAGFWRFSERSVQRNIIWDGALVETATFGMGLLRERLTQIVKVYALMFQDGELTGRSISVSEHRLFSIYRFQLDKLDV